MTLVNNSTKTTGGSQIQNETRTITCPSGSRLLVNFLSITEFNGPVIEAKFGSNPAFASSSNEPVSKAFSGGPFVGGVDEDLVLSTTPTVGLAFHTVTYTTF